MQIITSYVLFFMNIHRHAWLKLSFVCIHTEYRRGKNYIANSIHSCFVNLSSFKNKTYLWLLYVIWICHLQCIHTFAIPFLLKLNKQHTNVKLHISAYFCSWRIHKERSIDQVTIFETNVFFIRPSSGSGFFLSHFHRIIHASL